jgi:hypothetical protein
VGSSGPGSPGGLVVEVEGVGSVVVVGWIVVVVDTAWAAGCSVPELLSTPKAPNASAMANDNACVPPFYSTVPIGDPHCRRRSTDRACVHIGRGNRNRKTGAEVLPDTTVTLVIAAASDHSGSADFRSVEHCVRSACA